MYVEKILTVNRYMYVNHKHEMVLFCYKHKLRLRRCIPHESTKECVISFCIILCLHAFLYCVHIYHDNNVAAAELIIER